MSELTANDYAVAQEIVTLSAKHFEFWTPWEDYIIEWARSVAATPLDIVRAKAACAAAQRGEIHWEKAEEETAREIGAERFWDDQWRAAKITQMHAHAARRVRAS